VLSDDQKAAISEMFELHTPATTSATTAAAATTATASVADAAAVYGPPTKADARANSSARKVAASRKRNVNTTESDDDLFNKWLNSKIKKNEAKINLMNSEIEKNTAKKELIGLLKSKTSMEIKSMGLANPNCVIDSGVFSFNGVSLVLATPNCVIDPDVFMLNAES